MPRTALNPQTIVKNTEATVTMVAADSANGMEFLNDGNTELLIQNGGMSPVTVTVSSVADPWGRTGDLSFAVAAGAIAAVPVLDPLIWNQQGAGAVNNVFIGFSESSSVTVAAIRRG